MTFLTSLIIVNMELFSMHAKVPTMKANFSFFCVTPLRAY